MRTPLALAIAVAAVAAASAIAAVGQPASPPAPPAITVSMSAPPDIMPNAPSAGLPAAAAFAWNEFFALNWTAQTTGANGPQRDTPDASCHFGDPACTTLTRPKVWQTFRGKVEIFPGNRSAPASYASPPPDNPPTWSYGYDGGPSYVYASNFGPGGNATPGPCPSQSAAPAPWMNLDETDQITLDSMYAGSGPTPVPRASPGTTNSQPQLIRFVAKANRTMYSYIEGNGLWLGGVGAKPVAGAADPPPAAPPYNGTRPKVISFPNGTIETKSAWRPLNAVEMSSGHFVMAPVRYYETSTGKVAGTCWRQDTFGLVALHIIQKTPTAPYFIYATFEQGENIQTQGGTAAEDVNGAPVPCVLGATVPCPANLPPTTPQTVLQDITSPPNPPPISIPPQVNRLVGKLILPPSAPGGYCTNAGKRLYYLNASTKRALPRGGFICVNRRDNAIPPAIVDANKAAHAALASYEAKNGGYHSPFEYYKLINVQSVPIDKPAVGPFRGPNPATFSLANIVVETNRSLQTFSGSLVGVGFTGSNSDFAPLFRQPPALGQTFKNVYYNKGVYDMGGCMGCHGTQGQQRGSDFSVIAFQGAVTTPEYPAPILAGAGAAAVPRNRYLGNVPPFQRSHY